MISLRKMNSNEYIVFLARSIPNYAKDKVQAGNWSAEEANQKSLQDHMKFLPLGIDTPHHYFYMIEKEVASVGSIWIEIKLQPSNSTAFLFDLYIEEPFRHQGIGFKAMKLLEIEALSLGAKELALHVFGFNLMAIKLYQKLGFEVTNINMSKFL